MNTKTPDKVYTGLRRFNVVMGVLHLIQGILMIVLSNDTAYPIFTNYLKFNTETFSLSPDPKLWLELRFGPAVALFLLISAVAHFYLATFGFKRYVRNLKRKMNPVRFYEYALSSSLMIVLIGMLAGVWDFGSLILMFGINAMMNLFGIMMEYHNQHTERTDWTSFIYGCIAGIIPWILIFTYFYTSINSSDAKPPGVRLRHHPHDLRLLQHIRGQYVVAIQEDRPVEELSLRGTRLHHPQPRREDGPRLADLRRDAGARYEFVDSHTIARPSRTGDFVCAASVVSIGNLSAS